MMSLNFNVLSSSEKEQSRRITLKTVQLVTLLKIYGSPESVRLIDNIMAQGLLVPLAIPHIEFRDRTKENHDLIKHQMRKLITSLRDIKDQQPYADASFRNEARRLRSTLACGLMEMDQFT